MTFSHPLLAACALAFLPSAYLAQRSAEISWRRIALVYSDLAFLTTALRASFWPVVVLDAARSVGIALVLLAAAGPRLPVTLTLHDAAIAICMDTSGSMRASDVWPTRAVAALHAVRAVAAGLPSGTKIGAVSFAGTAQVLALPTADRNAVDLALRSAPGPNGQTALGDGVRAAFDILPASGARSIVLITDGVSNAGEDPSHVIRDLQRAHIRLYAIGVGGNASAARILRSYAAASGGSFAGVDSAAQFARAFARIAEAATRRRQASDLAELSALAGLFMLAAAWVASAWAGRLSFLGEPERHEPLGHLDDAPQLRRAGRDRDPR
ncbi:MAG TPA: vWA domain-containing protein [Candidatus Rubrimentiphilum sp.]|nr:vWA domain-containing protein [Candidatus Rubrimentiphilum sp.]